MPPPSNASSGPDDALVGRRALRFVVLLGIVSLFADVTYEGARAIAGPYLAALGAGGTAVGVVAGFGELAGYALRLVSGLITDRTRRYWTLTITGYAVNLLAVPCLALAGRWEIAAALLVTERIGKALRNPPRDAMLSYATHRLGAGWAFGLHEALDQIGAITGPLIVAAVLHFRHSYRQGFAVLLLPALAALTVLVAARHLYPQPHDLDPRSAQLTPRGFGPRFWLYLGAAALFASGFIDFPLIAYHFQKSGTVATAWIPVFYALAMGVDALAALVFGRWFDRAGIAVLAVAPLLSAAAVPLAFLGGVWHAGAAMALWGVAMGAQESVLRAAIAGLAAPERRATAYGLFNALFGAAWFAGSALLGFLYDVSLPALIAVSIALQALAAPLFFRLRRTSH